MDTKELLKQVAVHISRKEPDRIIPYLSRMSVISSDAISLPLKMYNLNSMQRFQEAEILANDFFKKNFSVEVGREYIRTLCLQGRTEKAKKFKRMLAHLETIHTPLNN